MATNDKTTRDIRKTLKDSYVGRLTSSTARMFLDTGKDMLKQQTPTVHSFLETNQEVLRDTAKFLRNPADVINKTVDRALETEDAKAVMKLVKNAVDDLKSGKIYDPDRDRTSFGSSFDDMMSSFGGFDMTGFDENGDWDGLDTDEGDDAEVQIAIAEKQEESAAKRTGATIGAIATSTEATVGAIGSASQNNIRLSVKQHAEMMNMFGNSLKVQATALQASEQASKAMLEVTRQAHMDVMGQLKSMTTILEDIRANTHVDRPVTREYKEPMDIFDASGALNIRNYIKQVGKNFDNAYNVKSISSMMTGGMSISQLVDLVASNPWQLAAQGILGKAIPKKFQDQLSKTDNNMKSFIPALLDKLATQAGGWKDKNGEQSLIGLIAEQFGIKQSTRSTIDTNVQIRDLNAQIGFTKRSAIALEQVIPSLLARIDAHISGEDMVVYNYNRGIFEKTSDVLSRTYHKAKDVVGSTSAAQDVIRMAGKLQFKTDNERDEFKAFVRNYIQNMATQSSGSFIGKTDKDSEAFRNAKPAGANGDLYASLLDAILDTMPRSDRMRLSMDILDAKRTGNRRNFELNQELQDNGLGAAFNGAYGFKKMSIIKSATEKEIGALSGRKLEAVLTDNQAKILAEGGTKGTNILLTDMLNTLKKGIVTYTYIVKDFRSNKRVADKIEASYPAVIASAMDETKAQYERDQKAKELANQDKRYDAERESRQREAADDKIKSTVLPLEKQYITDSTDYETAKNQLAAIIRGETGKGQSDNPYVEWTRKMSDKISGSAADVLKQTGTLDIWSTIKKIANSPFDFMTDALKVTDAFMFKMLYGEDAMMELDNGSSPSLMKSVTTAVKLQFLDAKNWFKDNIGDPLRKQLFDKDEGLLPRVGKRLAEGLGKVFKPITDRINEKTNAVKERIIGVEGKNEDGTGNGIYSGGMLSDKINMIRGTGEGSIENKIENAFDRLLYGNYASTKGVKSVMDRDAKGQFSGSHKEYGGIIGRFKQASDNLQDWLFGSNKDLKDPDSEAGQNTKYSRERWNQTKKALGEAAPDMTIGAGAGFLASFFLPGGPVLGALMGSAMGLVKGSTELRKWLFGEESVTEEVDPVTGKTRQVKKASGGQISSEVYEGFHKFAPKVTKGALLGAAAGGLGLLPFGIGPVIGGIFGALGGVGAASDQFREILFGRADDETGESGLISKNFRDRLKDTIKEVAPGAATGAVIGNIVGSGLGLIPGLSLLPTGPIFTMLGAITGGVHSSDIRRFFFGDEVEGTEIDPKTGKEVKVKKRQGGVFGKMFDAVRDKAISPLTAKINEIGGKIHEWFDNDVIAPFRNAMQPMKDALTEAGDHIWEAAQNVSDAVIGGIKRAIGVAFESPLGKAVKEMADKMKKKTNEVIGMIGKAIGKVIAAPFKLMEYLATGKVRSTDDNLASMTDDQLRERGWSDKRITKFRARIDKRNEGRVKMYETLYAKDLAKTHATAATGSGNEAGQGTEGNGALPTTSDLDGTDYSARSASGNTSEGNVEASSDSPETETSSAEPVAPGATTAPKKRKKRSKKKRSDSTTADETGTENGSGNSNVIGNGGAAGDLAASAARNAVAAASAEANKTAETLTSGSDSSGIGGSGKKTKSANEYLRDMAKDTSSILGEIKGQLGGLGWNTAYIKAILDKKFGALSDDELPEEMEGSTKSVKKHRGFFGRAFDKVTGFGRKVKNKVLGVKDWFQEKVEHVGEALGHLGDAVGGVVNTLFDIVKMIGKGIWTVLKDTVKAVGVVVPALAKGAWGATKIVAKGSWDAAKFLGKGALGAAQGLGNMLGGVFEGLGKAVPGILSGIGGVLGGAAKGVGAAVGAAGRGIGWVGKKIGGGAKWLFDRVFNFAGGEADEDGKHKGLIGGIRDKITGRAKGQKVHVTGGTVDARPMVGPRTKPYVLPTVNILAGKLAGPGPAHAVAVWIMGANGSTPRGTSPESVSPERPTASPASPLPALPAESGTAPLALPPIGGTTGSTANDNTNSAASTGDVTNKTLNDAMKENIEKQKFNKYKRTYEKIDAQSENSSNPSQVLDRAVSNANSMEELEAIKDVSDMNANNMLVEAVGGGGEGGEGKGSGLLGGIIGSLGTKIGQGLLAKFGATKLGKALGTAGTVIKSGLSLGSVGSAIGLGAAVARGDKEEAVEQGAMSVGRFISNVVKKDKGGIASKLIGNFTAGANLVGEQMGLNGGKLLSAVSDVAGTGNGVVSKILSKVAGMADKVLSYVAKKFPKFAGAMSSVKGKFTGKLAEMLKGVTSEAASGFLKKLGIIITVATTIYDFGSGMAEGAKILKIDGSNLTTGMRVAAGLSKALSNLAFGLIPTTWLATTIYKLFAKDEDDEKLNEAQTKFKEAASASGMTLEDYNDQQNLGMWGQIDRGLSNVPLAGALYKGGKAVVKGVGNVAKGVGNAVFHPIKTIKGLFGGGPGVTAMSQRDAKYNRGGNNMALAGCGPTSLAMVGSAYGVNLNPKEMSDAAYGMGMRAADGGTNPAFFSQAAGIYGSGFGMREGPVNGNLVAGNLRNNQPVVLMGKGGAFGPHMHYLVADKQYGRGGRTSIVDPLTGSRKLVSTNKLMSNSQNAIYSYGTGADVDVTGATTVGNAQQALVNKMRSVQGKLRYSLNWNEQNPDIGAASCASTVGWAYDKVLGIKGMSANALESSRNKNFTTIYQNNGNNPLDPSILQPGDLIYTDWNRTAYNPSKMSHAEMYAGNGVDLSHGGGQNGTEYGPTEKPLNAYRIQHTMLVRRYNGFMDGSSPKVLDNGLKTNTAGFTTGNGTTVDSQPTDGGIGGNLFSNIPILNSLSSLFSAASSNLAEKANSRTGGLLGNVISGIGAIGNGVKNVVGGIFNGVKNFFSGGGTSSTSIGAGGNIPASLSGDDAQKAWQYLMENGYSPFGAAGLMGCWQNESGIQARRVEGDYLGSFKSNYGYDKVFSSQQAMDDWVEKGLFRAYDKSYTPYSDQSVKGLNKGGYIHEGHRWPGIGLAQWTGGRSKALYDYAKAHGVDWGKIETQLGYFGTETQGAYKGLKEKLNAATSPEDGARIALDNFEMYNGWSNTSKGKEQLAARAASAKQVYAKFAGQNVGETGAGPGLRSSALQPRDLMGGWGTGSTTLKVSSDALNDRVRSMNQMISAYNDSRKNDPSAEASAIVDGLSKLTADPRTGEGVEVIAQAVKVMVELLSDIKQNTDPDNRPKEEEKPGDYIPTATPTRKSSQYSDYETAANIVNNLTKKS